jgi:hypothetical protein
MEKFELYPPVGQPEVRELTWDDMRRLAEHDPLARNAVTMAERGDWTREQALIVLAFASYNQLREAHHRELKRIDEAAVDFIITKDGKRYDRRNS